MHTNSWVQKAILVSEYNKFVDMLTAVSLFPFMAISNALLEVIHHAACY